MKPQPTAQADCRLGKLGATCCWGCLMLRFEITKETITLSDDSGKTLGQIPNTITHERQIFADPEKAHAALKKLFKSSIKRRFYLFKPIIEVNINYELLGGPCPVDESLVRDIFECAGAREVRIVWLQEYHQ